MTTRITDKDFFTMIHNMALDVAELPIENELVAQWAQKKLDQLEHKKEVARKRAADKRAAGDPLMDAVLAVLTDEFQTLGDIAAQIEGEDVTVGKISYRLSALASGDDPKVEKGQIQVKEEGSRARRLVGYKLA